MKITDFFILFCKSLTLTNILNVTTKSDPKGSHIIIKDKNIGII